MNTLVHTTSNLPRITLMLFFFIIYHLCARSFSALTTNVISYIHPLFPPALPLLTLKHTHNTKKAKKHLIHITAKIYI